MKSKWTGALLLSVVAVCVYAANVLATSPATTFVKSTFDEIDLKGHALTLRNVDDGKTLPDRWFASLKTRGRSDVYVVDNKFSPGATSGWHSHPGPSLILVVSGTVTNYTGDDPGCSPRTYSAGTGFVDPGGEDAHMLRNETADPAETIAVQLLPTGAPRKTDATAPANCPA